MENTLLSCPPQLRNVLGDGACFFRAICQSLYAVDEEFKATLLRQQMFQQLRAFSVDQNAWPRGFFPTHAAFLEHMAHMLLNEGESLEQYAAKMERPQQWAQPNDAVLASILLHRTVVILRPALWKAQAREQLPQFNDPKAARRLDVYFKDGQHLNMKLDFPLDNLGKFTVRKCMGRGKIAQRLVENPIAVWYNGFNHFQTIILTPATNPTAKCVAVPKAAASKPPAQKMSKALKRRSRRITLEVVKKVQKQESEALHDTCQSK